MNLGKRSRVLLALMTLFMAFAMVTVDSADARRGGSFGSRGFRTYQAPAITRTAPREVSPLQRSMTPRSQTGEPSAAMRQNGFGTGMGRRGMFGGAFGGLLGGLMLGGLFGMLMGHGFGGLGGILSMFFQLALLAVGFMLLMRFLGGSRQPQAYGGPRMSDTSHRYEAPHGRIEPEQFGTGGGSAAAGGATGGDEIGVGQADLDAFERLLGEIQDAFAREDYQALRERCTPEIVSYLSEELSQNAVKGLRNEVMDVKLLQGDLAEAWREGDREYATAALRYESRDVMRERDSGRVVSGDPGRVTETTEIWTFVRPVGGEWQLSAIQET